MTETSSLTTPAHGQSQSTEHRAPGGAARTPRPGLHHLAVDTSPAALVRRRWPLMVAAAWVEVFACTDLAENGVNLITLLSLLAGPLVILAEHAPTLTCLALLVQVLPQAAYGTFTAAHPAAAIVGGILAAHRHDLLTALLVAYWVGAGLLSPLVTGQPQSVPGVTLMVALMAMALGIMVRNWGTRRFSDLLRHRRRRKNQDALMSRQLHDTLAHANTRMILQARHTEAIDPRSAPAADPLDGIVTEGQDSVADLAGLLHLTKSSSAALATLDPDLEGALERAQDTLSKAGLRPRLMIDGTITSLPPLIASVMTRTLNESASNMTKYAATGSQCTIMVEVTPTRAGLMTTNDLPDGDPTVGPVMTSGLGLIGLQEHAAALGGDLVHATRGRLWTLTLSLPLPEGNLS